MPSTTAALQRSRSCWSESGPFRPAMASSASMLQRSRSCWSESGRTCVPLGRAGACFNEVAPAGASQAPASIWLTIVFMVLQRSRSCWSESGHPARDKHAVKVLLQRSRSWWSESGYSAHLIAQDVPILQRSRSWWSESGCWSTEHDHRSPRFNEVAPGGASQARPPDPQTGS